MFHIGQTFTASAFSESQIERMRLAPKSNTTACFAIVSPTLKARTELQTLSEMSMEELMMEVDFLRISDQAFRQSLLNDY